MPVKQPMKYLHYIAYQNICLHAHGCCGRTKREERAEDMRYLNPLCLLCLPYEGRYL